MVAILAFGVFLYWLFKPAPRPATLANKIAASSQNSQYQSASEEEGKVPEEKLVAFDYTLETFDGKKVTLSEINRDKPVVIQIWATWCEVCAREFPDNNKIAQKYKDKIEYHAVNIGGSDQTPKAIENYVKRMNLDPEAIKFLVDMRATVSQAYGFYATPQHLFIAKGGQIIFFKPGYMRADEMEAQIEALLAKN